MFKRKVVPVPNEEEDIFLEGVQTWIVRWISKQGSYPFNSVRPEIEMFTSREEADIFQEALQAANRLLRNTWGVDKPLVQKND